PFGGDLPNGLLSSGPGGAFAASPFFTTFRPSGAVLPPPGHVHSLSHPFPAALPQAGQNPSAMNTFDAKHIKNIALLGSHGSGKTTLAETMLFEAGLITRRGRVEEKNTVSDHHELEHERGGSVYSTCLHTEWRNYKINIIVTPGLDDVVGETIPALRVADTCVLLLNAQHGVEVGTDLVWQ